MICVYKTLDNRQNKSKIGRICGLSSSQSFHYGYSKSVAMTINNIVANL